MRSPFVKWSTIKWQNTVSLMFCPKHGLRKAHPVSMTDIPAGTMHRLDGRWRVRAKRRTGGLTWKMLKPTDARVQRVKVLMLLQGVP